MIIRLESSTNTGRFEDSARSAKWPRINGRQEARGSNPCSFTGTRSRDSGSLEFLVLVGGSDVAGPPTARGKIAEAGWISSDLRSMSPDDSRGCRPTRVAVPDCEQHRGVVSPLVDHIVDQGTVIFRTGGTGR